MALGRATPAGAEPAPTQEALVLLRVLAYDRYVARRSGRSVVVGVLRDDGDPASRRAAATMADALRQASRGMTVAGKPVAIVELPAGELLRDRLRDLEVTALYLPVGLDDELAAVSQAAESHPCLTFTDRVAYLRRGAAVALARDVERGRIGISIDLVATRLQGAKLSAELLRVARVVRR